MDEKARLMKALFHDPKKRHLNIKFLRGFSDESSVEDLCRETNKAFNQVALGLVVPKKSFPEDEALVDVSTLPVT